VQRPVRAPQTSLERLMTITLARRLIWSRGHWRPAKPGLGLGQPTQMQNAEQQHLHALQPGLRPGLRTFAWNDDSTQRQGNRLLAEIEAAEKRFFYRRPHIAQQRALGQAAQTTHQGSQ